MSSWRTATLDEIERRPGGWIPIRAHLGVQALGVNAWTADNAGDTVVGEHTEQRVGHEELYLVLRGHAAFTVAGDKIDARQGTIVFVRDPSASRKAVAIEPGTTILSAGGKPGEAFSVSSWELASPYGNRGMALYGEQKYEEAAAAFEEGIEAVPDFPGVYYNAGCMRARTGDTERALEHLRRAIELDPSFAELAKSDSDFDPIREQVSELTG